MRQKISYIAKTPLRKCIVWSRKKYFPSSFLFWKFQTHRKSERIEYPYILHLHFTSCSRSLNLFCLRVVYVFMHTHLFPPETFHPFIPSTSSLKYLCMRLPRIGTLTFITIKPLWLKKININSMSCNIYIPHI